MRSEIYGKSGRVRHPYVTLALVLAGFVFNPTGAGAQVNFTGELRPELIFAIPRDDGYGGSPLNTGNQNLGLNDFMFSSQIDLKLNAAGDSAGMDLWFQIKQYPIADMFLGTASIVELLPDSNPISGGDILLGLSAGVADLFLIADSYIFTLDLMRANVSWTPIDWLRLTVGRQSFLTGYGYGWNPVDLANPPKDPTNPAAYLRGVDALSLQFDPAAWFTAKLYGALPSEGFSWAYEDLLAGCELTFYAPSTEFKIAGLWGGVEQSGDEYDVYPHALAAGVYLDLFGLGLYGEGVLRSRSRRNDPDAAGANPSLESGPVWSVLGGMEYYFASGISLAVEYFYNGEGWAKDERLDYLNAWSVPTVSQGRYLLLYTPTYFAQHYLLMNLNVPWYVLDAAFNFNAIYSPDSQAFIITPGLSFNLNYDGTLVSNLQYSGMFSFDDSEANESWLAPVRHSLSLDLKYFF